MEGRTDRGLSHRFHQCNDRVRSQDSHVPPDRGHARALLADYQCTDAGTGFGAVVTGFSGTWLSCSFYRRDRAEPGEHVVESDRQTEGRAQLDGYFFLGLSACQSSSFNIRPKALNSPAPCRNSPPSMRMTSPLM